MAEPAAVESIEERVAKLAYILGEGATEISNEIQREILEELYVIRDQIARDPQAVETMANEAVRAEIKGLTEENEKMKYRIEHMKRYVK
jgi:hypothetical protein